MSTSHTHSLTGTLCWSAGTVQWTAATSPARRPTETASQVRKGFGLRALVSARGLRMRRQILFAKPTCPLHMIAGAMHASGAGRPALRASRTPRILSLSQFRTGITSTAFASSSQRKHASMTVVYTSSASRRRGQASQVLLLWCHLLQESSLPRVMPTSAHLTGEPHCATSYWSHNAAAGGAACSVKSVSRHMSHCSAGMACDAAGLVKLPAQPVKVPAPNTRLAKL
jgi:hypothetical protein